MRWQARSDAAIVPVSKPLMCWNVVELGFRWLERSVRDEEAAEPPWPALVGVAGCWPLC
jgi:hypothetical protein